MVKLEIKYFIDLIIYITVKCESFILNYVLDVGTIKTKNREFGSK